MTTCSFDGCTRTDLKGPDRLCGGHYSQKWRGKELRPLRVRNLDAYHMKDGYRRIYRPGEPGVMKHGQILEHRYFMQQHLGRPLLPHEHVHHINGDRADNRLENLELWTRRHPTGSRVEDHTDWAIEHLALYKPDALNPLLFTALVRGRRDLNQM